MKPGSRRESGSVPYPEGCAASLFSRCLLKAVTELFSLNKAAMLSQGIIGGEGNFGMERENLRLTGIGAKS